MSHNVLLSVLADIGIDLTASGEDVRFEQGETILSADEPLTHLYFLEGGVASMLADRPGDRRAEVAVIGREGVCGSAALLMADTSGHDIILQVDDSKALRVPVSIVRAEMDEHPAMRDLLLRYVHVFFAQLASNSVANLSERLDVRLARWLLMCHDRIDGDVIFITHDFTAIMIGSQRSAVTGALHILEGNRLIAADRGAIRVLDRAGLEALAGITYGAAEAQYRETIAPFGKNQRLETALSR